MLRATVLAEALPAEALPAVSADGADVPWQPRSPGWFRRLVLGMTAGDILALAVSLAVASVVRFGIDEDGLPGVSAGSIVAAVCIGCAWLVALWGVRSRAKRIVGQGLTEFQRVTNATVLTFGVVAIVCYVAAIPFARGYIAVALPLGGLLLLANRVVWRRLLLAMRRRGRCLVGAIVVGSTADVERTVRELGRNVGAGYRAVAVSLTDAPAGDPAGDSGPLADYPHIHPDDLVAVTRVSRVRALLVAGELPGGRDRIRSLGWALENSCAELILVSRLTDVAGPRIHLRPVPGLPMVHVQLPRYSGFAHTVKRTFDVVAASIALVVLAPVMLATAVAVRSDGGPAIFRQTRVGRSGSTFVMLKFRSMVVDAEMRRAELADRDEGGGVLFKVRDDPRVTRVGRVLRRSSVDELPQLWNVLRGEMSLVGPRPPLPDEVDGYRGHETRRLLSKPGITGLWQVSGRSDLTWEESVRLDLYYVENWSFTGDLMLLLKTVVQMVKRDGAY